MLRVASSFAAPRGFAAAVRAASTLVIAAQDSKGLTTATLSAITAAQKLSPECTVLVSNSPTGAEQAATIAGVTKVVRSKTERPSAAAIAKMVTERGFTHVVAASGNALKDFGPRVAAALDVSPVTEIVAVVDEATFVRPMYAGNALATVKVSGSPTYLSVRVTAFEKAALGGGSALIEDLDLDASPTAATFISAKESSSERPDLTAAPAVVSGGRGMKDGKNFVMLDKLAAKLGAAVGASRAAVDAGMVPNEYQVGQTGKVVAPDLYIAVGISGAIQHLSGMKDSKTIVAINKDPEAPIFTVADFGLVADLFDAVPELTDKL